MPLRFLFDEHLRGPLWRAVLRYNLPGRQPLDVVRVGDPSDLPLKTEDPQILLWAEREGRVLVTSDKNTMPQHLVAHLQDGHHSPGVFMLRSGKEIQVIIQFLVLAAYASEPTEWNDRVEFIPF